VILSDTPGIIKPAYQLQASMMDFVKSAFEDAVITQGTKRKNNAEF